MEEKNITNDNITFLDDSLVSEDTIEIVDVETDYNAIDVEPPYETEIDLEESMGWVGGDSAKHYSLIGRDEPDQHPIKSIIGLRDELDKIEALQTVYSDQNGVANYYKWADGAYDEAGYFVSIVPSTTHISICDGADIFGVTVDNAAFVGGQDDIARGKDYALVVTSGAVGVRCESDVSVGDCVVSNERGMATKTTSGCGYKVLALSNKNGVLYAIISLGVQACTTDLLGHSVRQLEKQLDDAEINIAAAMNTANEAYKKADNVVASKEIMDQQMAEVVDKVDNALTDVENMETQVEKAMEVTAQARAIAESAVVSAETAKNDAISAANDALAKAGEIEKDVDAFISDWTFTDPITGEKNTGATYITEYIDNGLSTKAELETVEKLDEENKLLIEKNAENYSRMISSVDKYSVGEYSQAYGLTIEQAKSILKDGMVYIPTGGTHNETYNSTIGDPIVYSFTNGFYYIWDENIWMEGIGKVWFGSEQPSGDTYVYWFDDTTLFILQDGKWIEVAVLAGNVNNRITSMVKQNVNNVSIGVSNAAKAIANIDLRVHNTEAIMNSYVAWPSDESGQRFNMSLIDLSASQDKSSIALAVYDKDGDKILKGAEIVLSQDGEGSFVQISADNIVMDGTVSFIKPEDLGTSGSTQIDGGRIMTGTISADRIDVDNLKVKAANITGTLVVKNNTNTLFSADLTNNAVEIAGWKAYNGSLYSGTDFTNSTCFLCSKPEGTAGKMIIGGSENISGWVLKAGAHFGVTYQGKLYAEDAEIQGKITSSSGQIGGWNLDSNSLYSGTTFATSACFICTGSTGTSGTFNIGGSGNISGWVLKAGNNFGVTNAGAMYASSGRIGGWTIDASTLHGTTTGANNQTAKIEISPMRCYYEYSPTNYRETGWWNVVNAGYYYSTTYSGDSDVNVKNNISSLDSYDVVFDNLKPCRYRYNYGTSERYHTGFIAQEVVSAVESAGLTTQDFAGVIHLEEPNENGSEWMLRRDEFVALNTWQIQKAKTRITELEKKVAELEALINKT